VVDPDALAARLCDLADQAGRQLAAADRLIAELMVERDQALVERDQALVERDRARRERDRALARCRRLRAGRAA
jgi:hypothetical protein